MKETLLASELAQVLRHVAKAVDGQKEYLSELDSVLGDGDHGVSMARGFRAVDDKLASLVTDDCGAVLSTVGTTLMSVIGGATGPIFGTWFIKAAQTAKGKPELTLADLAAAFVAGLDGVKQLGKAEPGDKTMVDALEPAVRALQAAVAHEPPERDMAVGCRAAAQAARAGAEATIPLVAKKGRSRYAGENAIGHQDAGATSVAVILEAMAEAI